MTYCVALIGSIASGKSTAARYFRNQKVEVINADEIAKDLVAPETPAWIEITAHFGSDILTTDKQIDRRQLRHRILENSTDRIWLESCLHPRIRQAIQEKIKHTRSPYAVIEIPLLKERQSYPYIARILLIQAPVSDKVARIIKRDGCTEKEALRFLHIQQELEGTQQKLADDVIKNDSSLQKLEEKLAKLHKHYLKAAKNASMSSFVKDEK